METEGDQLVKDAATNQAAQDKATKDYVGDTGAGTDQAEAYANDPKNASGSGQGGGLSRFEKTVKGLTTVVGRNKQKLGIGGGAAGLLLAIILGFAALLPLKLESLLDNVFKAEFSRMENYAERRAQKVVYRYLVDKVGGAAGSDPIYLSNNLFKTLYGNMRLNSFEDKLLKEKGIKITKGVDPHTINIELADGSKLNNADIERLSKYLDAGDLKGKSARDAIKAFTKETTKWNQILKRRHLRRYIQNAYGIRKWALPERTDKEAASTDPKLPSPTQTDVSETTLQVAEEADAAAIDCILSDKCPEVDKRTSPDGVHKGGPAINDGQNPDEAKAAEDDKALAADETKKSVKSSFDEVRKSSQAAISSGIEKTLTKVFTKGIAEAFTKSVPVVGWIALASSIDNFMWNGHIRTVMIAMRSAQYASVFANYSSIKDQLKEGKLGGRQVNDIMVAFEGSEKSAAFQKIYMNSDSGEKISPSQAIGNLFGSNVTGTGGTPLNGCDATYFFEHFQDNPKFEPSNPDYWTLVYRLVASNPSGLMHTSLCMVHPILDILSKILANVLGFGLDLITTVLNFLSFGVFGTLADNAMHGVATLMTFAMEKVFTPVATGFETKAPLYNAIDAGGDVTANQFTRDALGGKTISAQEAHNQVAAINRAEAQNLRQQGMIASIFSLDSSQSLASQLLAKMPSSPGYAFEQFSTTAMAVISSPFKFFSAVGFGFVPTAGAGVITDAYGVQQSGFTSAELDDNELHIATEDIAGPPGADGVLTGKDGLIDEFDCKPVDDPTLPNLCLIDSAVIQSMNSVYTTDDDGGLTVTAQTSASSGNGGAPTPINGSAVDMAKQILALEAAHKLSFQQNADRQDVVNTANGTPITACGLNAGLDPAMLKIILTAAQKYTFSINALASGHHCGTQHGKGKAVDFGNVNGVVTTSSSLSTSLYREFATYAGSVIPSGGGVGQLLQLGKLTLQAGVMQFDDVPNHVHMQVP